MPKPKPSTADRTPDRPTLASIREAATNGQACDLHTCASQPVVAGGARKAEVTLVVGEQPGDSEARSGPPLVSF